MTKIVEGLPDLYSKYIHMIRENDSRFFFVPGTRYYVGIDWKIIMVSVNLVPGGTTQKVPAFQPFGKNYM